jgi:hypothetical protein
MLWCSNGIIAEILREVKTYFWLGLTIPLCDLVTMVHGRGTCVDWTSCVIDSIELDTERGEYFSYISSSVSGGTRYKSIMGSILSCCQVLVLSCCRFISGSFPGSATYN